MAWQKKTKSSVKSQPFDDILVYFDSQTTTHLSSVYSTVYVNWIL